MPDDLTPFEQLVLDRHLIVMDSLIRIQHRVRRLETSLEKAQELVRSIDQRVLVVPAEPWVQRQINEDAEDDAKDLKDQREGGSGEVGESSPDEGPGISGSHAKSPGHPPR